MQSRQFIIPTQIPITLSMMAYSLYLSVASIIFVGLFVAREKYQLLCNIPITQESKLNDKSTKTRSVRNMPAFENTWYHTKQYLDQSVDLLARPEVEGNIASIGTNNHVNVGGVVAGGHWERVDDISPPYVFSPRVCATSNITGGDCRKTTNFCSSSLMNWTYIGNDQKPYPRFDVQGFRRKMRNQRIMFVGPSMVRQQVQALVWTLGHEHVQWDRSNPSLEYRERNNCTAERPCTIDTKGNITICYQFMGSMATKVYHEGHYTLDHSLRGHGDSSCLLKDEMIADMTNFDLVFVQTLAWWTNLNVELDSPSSPSAWVTKMIPRVYYDAVGDFLSKVSQRTNTVFVLGQTGTDCQNKSMPEPFSVNDIEDKYGWKIAPKLWDTSLAVIQEKRLDVQVVDAREPLMQSVHAHPSAAPDCLHFCMNSAAVNMYLDMYWNEVFSLL